MSSSQYVDDDCLPSNETQSLPTCSIPGAGILTCGFVPLQLMMSRMVLRLESWLCLTPSLDKKAERIEKDIRRHFNMRHLFVNNELFKSFPMLNSHSHPESAKHRTAVNHYIKKQVVLAGYDPYVVSMSNMDSIEGCRGSRLPYGLKDLSVKFCNDPVLDNDVIMMVDVDYYVDMNKWLAFGRPILLYTMVPTEAAYRENDFAYSIKDNEIHCEVAGGARYNHQLWNYHSDKTSVVNADGTLTTFLIEQRMIPGDPMHRFVCITPEARVTMPWWMYLEEKHQPLQRWQPLQGEVNVLYDPVSDKVSISRNGEWNCVNLTGELLETLKIRAAAKETLHIADIERVLNSHKVPNSIVYATQLYKMLDCVLVANVVKTNGAICYQPTGTLATEDGTCPGQQVCTPLVSDPALFPTKSVNSDEAMIIGRIDKMRNDKVPPPIYKRYANEFVQRIVPEKKIGIGVPLTVAQVCEKQNKPAQKSRFEQIRHTLSVEDWNKIQSFMKSEAYSNISDPRSISTMSASTTTLLSSYTLAFKEQMLKEIHWFGAGLKPRDQIRKLSLLCERGKGLLTTDYSRLDGTVSEFLQKYIGRAAYLRWAHPNHRADIKKQFDKVFIQIGHTSNGLKFKPGYGTRSGSPQTTDVNTEICAFVVYCAYRELGYSAEDAWLALGLYYGDDGATVADEGLANNLEMVARHLGLKLKCEFVEQGEPVPFLGRYFVDPLTSNDSFQDPWRTIRKLHLSSNKNVSREQAVANKAIGYLATDSMTPIISSWAKRCLKLTGINKAKNATHEEEFKMNLSWPQTDRELIEATFAKVMQTDVEDVRYFDKILLEVESLDQFPVLFNTVCETKIEADVGGEIRYPPATHVTSNDDDNDEKSAGASGCLPGLGAESAQSDRTVKQEPGRQAGRIRGQDPRRGPNARDRRDLVRGSRKLDRGKLPGVAGSDITHRSKATSTVAKEVSRCVRRGGRELGSQQPKTAGNPERGSRRAAGKRSGGAVRKPAHGTA